MDNPPAASPDAKARRTIARSIERASKRSLAIPDETRWRRIFPPGRPRCAPERSAREAQSRDRRAAHFLRVDSDRAAHTYRGDLSQLLNVRWHFPSSLIAPPSMKRE